jgi:hypothetical protein
MALEGDRSDTRRCHQALAMLVVIGDRLDLGHRRVNPSVEPAPVLDQIFDET